MAVTASHLKKAYDKLVRWCSSEFRSMGRDASFEVSTELLAYVAPSPKPHFINTHPLTQRNAHSARTDAPSGYPLFLHGRPTDRQRARPTNRVTRSRRTPVHWGHARVDTPSDRGRARVPRDVTWYRRWLTYARRCACARSRGRRVARRAAGRRCCFFTMAEPS